MPRTLTASRAVSTDELLQLAAGLSGITATVLWLSVALLTAAAPELCSSTANVLAHCPLCLPAALATLAALVSGGALLRRSLAA